MKKLITIGLVAAAFSLSAAAKEVTLSGEGKCAKCALKKADKCQNVVEVKEDGKTVTYYLSGDASNKFHNEICGGTKKVEVTGAVSEKDGQKWLAVSKIVAK